MKERFFFLLRYPWAEYLDHTVALSLTFWESVTLLGGLAEAVFEVPNFATSLAALFWTICRHPSVDLSGPLYIVFHSCESLFGLQLIMIWNYNARVHWTSWLFFNCIDRIKEMSSAGSLLKCLLQLQEPKLGTENLIHVFHVAGKHPTSWAITTVSQDAHGRELETEVGDQMQEFLCGT